MNLKLLSFKMQKTPVSYATVNFIYEGLRLKCHLCHHAQDKKWFVRLPFELHKWSNKFAFYPACYFDDESLHKAFQAESLRLIEEYAPGTLVDDPEPLPCIRKYRPEPLKKKSSTKSLPFKPGKARSQSIFNLKK